MFESPLSFSSNQNSSKSEPVTAEIVCNNIAPLPVETLTGDGKGDGTTVSLDWTGKEVIQLDLQLFDNNVT